MQIHKGPGFSKLSSQGLGTKKKEKKKKKKTRRKSGVQRRGLWRLGSK